MVLAPLEQCKLHKIVQGIEINGEIVGLITYMRTDSTDISKEAIETYRNYLKKILKWYCLMIRTYKKKS